MPRSLSLHITSLLFFQAAAFQWPVCDAATSTTPMTCETAPSLAHPSGLSFQPARYLHGAEKLSSILATANTPKHPHHRVGAIVGTCLGIAGAVLLVGLVLIWILLRHRHHAATVQAQDVVPRSWASSDILGSDRPVVVANQPSRSLDLAGTDTDNASVFPGTEETVEMKLWNKSTDVLDISVENASPSPLPSSPSPLPGPIEPYVPRQIPQSVPDLSIHTNVTVPAAAPQSSSSSHESTPTGSSRSLIRPLPIPPATRPQMRRPRSAKAEEARRESRRHNRLSRSALSADDLQAYVHGDRRSRARSISSISCEAGGCGMLVQHHDGGMDARIDLPPPYYECLQAPATLPSASRAHTLPVAWP